MPKQSNAWNRLRSWCQRAGGMAVLLMGCTDERLPFEAPAMFADPASLGREGCEAGALRGFAPGGIWHFDNASVAEGVFPSVIRYDQEVQRLTALVGGRPAGDVRLTADDLFARAEYQTADGDRQIRAYNACRLDPDGSLRGAFGRCQKGKCSTGTFRAVRVQRIPGEAEGQGIEKVSEWAGEPGAAWGKGITVNVRVKDGLAYLARYGAGLQIVDVRDPASPRDVGGPLTMRPADGEIYNDVKLADAPDGTRYALMASNRRGVVCIDVSEPAAPREVTSFPPVPEGEDHINVHTLFIESDGVSRRAYIADMTSGGLGVYDVTNPAIPVSLGAYVHPDVGARKRTASPAPRHIQNGNAFLHDLYVEAGRAYLSYWGLGLVVVDASSAPSTIALVGQYDGYARRTNHSNWVTTAGGRRIAVMGDEDFGAHVQIVGADPQSEDFLAKVGEFQLRPEVSVHNIIAYGDKAYVAHYQDGLRILDLADPSAPSLAAYFNTWDGRNGSSFYEGAVGIDVDIDSGLIYVADSERGLLIFREAM